jgi:hypothetical protein
MRIEAFTEGRDPARPEANEDRFLVLPGRAYAAIDGVTSRLGTRYDGMLSGQYGAVLVRDALEARLGGGRAAPGDARALVAELTATIAAAYARHGTLDVARRDPNHRFATTLALVLEHPSEIEILLVGDSGVRIGCARDIRLDKDLDRVTANLRQAAWRALAPACPDAARREALARRVTWNGAGQDPAGLEGALDAAALAALGAEAVASSLRAMPHLPRAEVERLVGGGILGAQGGFQNDPASPLGYSCLDGFAVAMGRVHHERLPRAGLSCVELYTDGYFRPGDGFGLEAWERAFAEVEREDPHKIGAHAGVKGSIGGMRSDDRTYVGVRWNS